MKEEKEKLEQNNRDDEDDEDVEAKSYELSFLINPSVGEEGISDEVGKLKKIIQDNSASILSEGEMQKKELAYEISKKTQGVNKKFQNAYFGWFRFDTMPSSLEAIKEKVDKDENILRHLLILVDKDRFIKRFEEGEHQKSQKTKTLPKQTQKAKKTEKTESEGKSKKSISKEEIKQIDKTIDEIVEGGEDMADKARSTK